MNQYCEGTTLPLNSNPSAHWNLSNAVFSSGSTSYQGSNPQVLLNQGGTDAIVSLQAVDTTNYCADIQNFSIGVTATPEAVSSIAGDTLVCPGSTVLYEIDNLTNLNSNSTYEWSIVGGTPSTNSGNTCLIEWNMIGPYAIHIQHKSQGLPNCNSSIFTQNIDTFPPLNPQIQGDSLVCLNVIHNYQVSNSSSSSIFWELSNSNLGSVVAGQGNTLIDVEYGDQSGNTMLYAHLSQCNTSYSDSINISVGTTNLATQLIIPDSACVETSVNFSTNMNTGSFYWDFGDGYTSTAASPSHQYNSPGLYNIQLQHNIGSCTINLSKYIHILGIGGNLFPNGSLDFCAGTNFIDTLQLALSNTANPTLVEWFLNGSLHQSGGNTLALSISPPAYNGAGTYTVAVTDNYGCTNTLDQSLTIDTVNCSGTCPIIQTIPYSAACDSSQGTMTFIFSSPSGTAVQWSNGSFGTSTQITYQYAGSYKIECFAPGASCPSGRVYIDVPLVVKWSHMAICDSLSNNPKQLQFSDNSSYLTGYGTTSYLWSFGDGSTSSLQNPIHSYAQAGSYTVNLAVNYGNYSCNKSMLVVVDSLDASYSYSGLFCENRPTVTFTSFSNNIVDWKWIFGDGASSGRSQPQRTYSTDGSYLTQLSVTNQDGCTADSSILIDIYDNPIILSMDSLGPLCSNHNAVNLDSLISYSNAQNETHVWSGAGVSFDSNTNTYLFDPSLAGAGSHQLCVNVTDSNLCYTEACFTVDVLCAKQPIIIGEKTHCATNTTIQLTTADNYSSYQWTVNGTVLSSSNNFILANISTAGSYQYILEATDHYGCSSSSEVFELTVHSNPIAPTISSNTSLCHGDSVTLTHNGTQAGVQYHWNTLPKQSGQSINTLAIAHYDYQLIARNDSTGCVTESNTISTPERIKIENVLSGCFCADDLITSSNGLTYISACYGWSYNWLIDGQAFTPTQNNSYIGLDLSDTNIYNKEITVEVSLYGCTQTSEPLIINDCSNCSDVIDTTLAEICQGDSFLIGSTFYDYNGVFLESTNSINDCDSSHYIQLSVLEPNSSSQQFSLCEGDSLYINNTYFYSDTMISQNMIGSNGCDSTHYIQINMLENSSGSQQHSFCEGDSLLLNNTYYYSDTAFSQVMIGSNGCDSIVHTSITTVPTPTVQMSFSTPFIISSVSGGTPSYYFEFGNQNGMLSSSSGNMGTNFPYYATSNGLYYFFVIDKNGCVSDTAFFQFGDSQIFNQEEDEILVHPNPADEYILVSSPLEKKIYNTLGEFLFSSKEEKLDISHLPQGIYYLKMQGYKPTVFIKR
jgi:PKD repeat protein